MVKRDLLIFFQMKNSRRKVLREQQRQNRRAKRGSRNFHFRVEWLILLGIFSIIGYIVYLSIVMTGIEKNDPLSKNGSSSYLLSKTSVDDMDKTLWVFEESNGSDAKIEKAFLVASNKEKEIILNVYIPGWIFFASTEDTLGNDISVSNFRYAGEFLEEGRGIEYSIWQFEQMLGTKVDSYVWINGKEQSLYSDVFGYFSQTEDTFNYDSTEETFTNDALMLDSLLDNYSPLKIVVHPKETEEIGEGIYSNMSFLEVINKISDTRKKLSSFSKHIIDLGGSDYTEEDLSDSGGVVYYFNSSAYDSSFRKYLEDMIDTSLEQEQVKVEVYNGSGISGAAEQMARKIENSGCDVVRYENAPDTIEKTVLYIPNEEKFKRATEIVEEVLGSSPEIINGRPSFMTTGDIVVVLGEDIKRMYSF